MGEQDLKHLKGAVEALLFVSEKAVTLNQFKESIVGSTVGDIKKVLKTLRDEYKERDAGMGIVEIANGYQMLSTSTYAEYIREFYKSTAKEKLSKPALETLAIVAYKQPVSRSDVEEIRGVNSDGVMGHLLNKGLIKITGRKEVPGRPFLHGTTTKFLEYFGLKDLDDLPNLDEMVLLNDNEDQTINSHSVKQEMIVDDEIHEGTTEDLIKQVHDDFEHKSEADEEISHTREELQRAIDEMEEAEITGEPSGQSRVAVPPEDTAADEDIDDKE